jgi:hypothetical protein
MSEHLYNINYVLKNKSNFLLLENFLNSKQDSFFLYKHFSESDHILVKDLKFQIFVSNCNLFRTRLESDLMYLFDTIHPNGLNSKISCNLNCLSNYKSPPLL